MSIIKTRKTKRKDRNWSGRGLDVLNEMEMRTSPMVSLKDHLPMIEKVRLLNKKYPHIYFYRQLLKNEIGNFSQEQMDEINFHFNIKYLNP